MQLHVEYIGRSCGACSQETACVSLFAEENRSDHLTIIREWGYVNGFHMCLKLLTICKIVFSACQVIDAHNRQNTPTS